MVVTSTCSKSSVCHGEMRLDGELRILVAEIGRRTININGRP